ncbi:unnamed protein product [Cladocopium goreaui]|uniref:Uncharacterized protein n=1 Tax=Cladocopium goreaui TaxID=2562237 RepID=A0A9P1BT32_9DINO|nr:unnamed protein product [Cladocopium goreaui]
MGLRASMQEPTMPAPTSAGGWTRQPLTSSEASVWMRELLQPWSPENLRDIATHSSKATVLSWMSKSNVDISLRRLAGYHIAPGDKSALEYSRDAAAPVLRQIEAIFIAVRANLFRPDLPRSQRWLEVQTLEDAVKLAALKPYRHGLSSDCHSSFDATMSDLHVNSSMPEDAQSLERDMETWPEFGDDTTLLELKKHSLNSFHSDPAHDMVASDISDDVSSRESSSDSDSASEDLERRALLDGERNAVDLVAPSDLANKECFKHKRSQKLHLVGRTSFGNKFFKCGRKCNENYEGLSTVPAFAAHGCMTCFGWSQKPASDSSISDDDFDSKVSVPVLGSSAHPEAALLRRLLFESYTLTATELKRKADNNESDGPKKLPVQEIATRFEALEKKLCPLKIESVLEPSHSLINSLAQCVDDGRLRFIEWSKCTSRTMELNNIKETSSLKVWKADSAGVIKQSEPESLLRCETGTDLEVLNALKRQGIAFELAKLMSFEKHEAIVNLLFSELQREPLEGFRRPTMAQLAEADREIHVKLSEKTRSGLPLGPQGELPLDQYVQQVLEMPAVMWLLMPKPKSALAERPSGAGPKPAPKKPAAPDDKKFPPRNKTKGKRAKTPMPAQLRGGTPIDNENRCFSASHNFLNHDKAS